MGDAVAGDVAVGAEIRLRDASSEAQKAGSVAARRRIAFLHVAAAAADNVGFRFWKAASPVALMFGRKPDLAIGNLLVGGAQIWRARSSAPG